MDMEARAERLASARAFVAKLKGRSAIPGLSVMDAHEGGTVGMEEGGTASATTHIRLHARARARVAHWLAIEVSMAAQQQHQ